MLEATVPSTMPSHVGPRLLSDRQQRGGPQPARVLVADIQDFARWIGDRIVRPRRQLVLAAVAAPGVAGTGFRQLEPEGGVRNHVDPRGGRPLALAQDRDVFAAVVDEAAQAVEELQRGPVWRRVTGGVRFGDAAGLRCRPAWDRACPS